MAKTILVIGGALSGPTAAARAREVDPQARIIILERSTDVSYAACGLNWHVSGEVPSLAALNRHKAQFFSDVYGIEVRTRVQVTSIDPVARIVIAGKEKLSYDSLIFAAGAESVVPNVPGFANAKNVTRFRNLNDLKLIMGQLRAGAKRVAILGGSFFGIEAADALLRRRCRVTLIEKKPRILHHFTESKAGQATKALVEAGSAILTGVTIMEAGVKSGKVKTLKFDTGQELPVDLVIVAAGLKPRTELLAKAGARLHSDGTVEVGQDCSTSVLGIYACGVCISLPHAVTGQPSWFAQGAQADRSAQVAGANAAGDNVKLAPVVGTAILRVGKLTLARTGLGSDEAERFAQGNFGCVRIQAPGCDSFLPQSSPLSIELFYNRSSGRILGAEASGQVGVDKRIDVIATAIAGGLTVDTLASLDLGYAPPYAPARDPVNVVGTVASADCRGKTKTWSPKELSQNLQKVSLIDLRSPSERRHGIIPSALAVTLAEVRSGKFPKDEGKSLVFISQSGRQAYLAARFQPKTGFLSGGMSAWIYEGLPVTRSRKK